MVRTGQISYERPQVQHKTKHTPTSRHLWRANCLSVYVCVSMCVCFKCFIPGGHMHHPAPQMRWMPWTQTGVCPKWTARTGSQANDAHHHFNRAFPQPYLINCMFNYPDDSRTHQTTHDLFAQLRQAVRVQGTGFRCMRVAISLTHPRQ